MQITQSVLYNKLSCHKNDFLGICDFHDLQLFLKVGGRELEYQINKPIYYSFEIPKKKGGTRKIQSPNADLISIQKKLNYYLQAVYLLVKPKEVHGFVIKPKDFELTHSIVTNASAHTNKKHLLNIDLKDFFPSISAKRVRHVLVKEVGLNDSQIADAIALLCTYQKALPTGAPTSPVLANFACLPMDKELASYCRLCDITFTRYADDLSFSSNDYFTSDIIKCVRTIIEKHQFTINEKKFRLLSSKSKQVVTGITVNKKVNVDRTYIRNLRATLHHIRTCGIAEASNKHYTAENSDFLLQAKLLHKLKGQIDFVGQVRGKEDVFYLRLLDSIKSFH